jgi:hypothetical protein
VRGQGPPTLKNAAGDMTLGILAAMQQEHYGSMTDLVI